MSCRESHYGKAGPLCEHELHFLRLGHTLVRHTRRYPLILLWLAS